MMQGFLRFDIENGWGHLMEENGYLLIIHNERFSLNLELVSAKASKPLVLD